MVEEKTIINKMYQNNRFQFVFFFAFSLTMTQPTIITVYADPILTSSAQYLLVTILNAFGGPFVIARLPEGITYGLQKLIITVVGHFL